MHGNNPIETVLENGSATTIPGELDITLIGKHWDAMRSPPHRRCVQVVKLSAWI
jgi:hypothetical protein